MNLHFTKMHGAGNDFIVINAMQSPFSLTSDTIRQLAHRQTGIGFDQLLVVEPSQVADFKYRIFNADGGEVAQCGNGARCFARFVVDQALTDQQSISVETASGIIHPILTENGEVTVDMGEPRFLPNEIPFNATEPTTLYPISVKGKTVNIAALSMGNPHAVLLVDDVHTAPVSSLGPAIESHADFPEHVNVGFMQVIDTHSINLRVYERGTGETLACGTGACAAVVAGIQQGLLVTPVTVHARGGDLIIDWQGEDHVVMMTGPAETVYTGEITLPPTESTDVKE